MGLKVVVARGVGGADCTGVEHCKFGGCGCVVPRGERRGANGAAPGIAGGILSRAPPPPLPPPVIPADAGTQGHGRTAAWLCIPGRARMPR